MHVVCVCHQDGRSKNTAVQKERLCLLEGISAPEVSQLLGERKRKWLEVGERCASQQAGVWRLAPRRCRYDACPEIETDSFAGLLSPSPTKKTQREGRMEPILRSNCLVPFFLCCLLCVKHLSRSTFSRLDIVCPSLGWPPAPSRGRGINKSSRFRPFRTDIYSTTLCWCCWRCSAVMTCRVGMQRPSDVKTIVPFRQTHWKVDRHAAASPLLCLVYRIFKLSPGTTAQQEQQHGTLGTNCLSLSLPPGRATGDPACGPAPASLFTRGRFHANMGNRELHRARVKCTCTLSSHQQSFVVRIEQSNRSLGRTRSSPTKISSALGRGLVLGFQT